MKFLESTMPISSTISRLSLLFLIITSFMISGCGTMPWNKKQSDEDLVFEQEFEPTEEIDSELDKGPTDSREEDDFFSEGKTGKKKSGKQDSMSMETESVKGGDEDFFLEDKKKETAPISGEQPVVEEELKVADSKETDDFFDADSSVEKSDDLDSFIEEESAKQEKMSGTDSEMGDLKSDSMDLPYSERARPSTG